MIRFNKLIENHTKDMGVINKQRHNWLIASSIVYVAVIILIFGWDWITNTHQKSLWWIFISLTLLISVNWWYWTMAVISHLLTHQQQEVEFIKELLTDIKELQDIIKNNIDKPN